VPDHINCRITPRKKSTLWNTKSPTTETPWTSVVVWAYSVWLCKLANPPRKIWFTWPDGASLHECPGDKTKHVHPKDHPIRLQIISNMYGPQAVDTETCTWVLLPILGFHFPNRILFFLRVHGWQEAMPYECNRPWMRCRNRTHVPGFIHVLSIRPCDHTGSVHLNQLAGVERRSTLTHLNQSLRKTRVRIGYIPLIYSWVIHFLQTVIVQLSKRSRSSRVMFSLIGTYTPRRRLPVIGTRSPKRAPKVSPPRQCTCVLL